MKTIKKTVFLVSLLLIATAAFSFGQRQKGDSLAIVVKAMAGSDIYEVSHTVGYAGSVSKQFQRFELLLSLATEQQLTDLAACNKNAVVRLYALQALKQKKANIPQSLMSQFQNDRTIVTMLKGCIGDKKAVNELAKQNLKSQYDLAD